MLRPLVKGLLTYVPVAGPLLAQRGAGHTDSAEYCYSVWLKHMTLLHAHGLKTTPRTVAELGPGESVGVGLAALLSGAEHYLGLDVTRTANMQRNVRILDELVALFRARAPRPDKGWPDFDSHLDARLFPSHILTEEVLQRTLASERIDRIRQALQGAQSGAASPSIKYMVPWSDPAVVEENSVDLVFSHSVLEHVVDLPATYRALHAWLRPGAWTSHQIDLKSHGMMKEWNGYRACSEPVWKIMMGRRPYLINRAPCSEHLRLMEEAGLQVALALQHHRADGLRRSQLAPRWSALSDEDLGCSGVFVLARKRLAN